MRVLKKKKEEEPNLAIESALAAGEINHLITAAGESDQTKDMAAPHMRAVFVTETVEETETSEIAEATAKDLIALEVIAMEEAPSTIAVAAEALAPALALTIVAGAVVIAGLASLIPDTIHLVREEKVTELRTTS